MNPNLFKFFCIIGTFGTFTSATVMVTSTTKPLTTTTTSATTQTPTETWNDLLKQLNSTLVGITISNINSKFRIMREITDDACESINLPKPVTQFQIAVYVESAVANLADNVKDNARFYLTKVLNDVVSCKS